MSRKYKFRDNDKLHFVTFSVVNRIDLFIRNEYKEILLESIRYCQLNKGLEVYGWCIMTGHAHMIIGAHNNKLSNIMRDLKRHSSETLHEHILHYPRESRREWMIRMMERAGRKNNTKFQLWQPELHPIELFDQKAAFQKLEYIHNNQVNAGFVKESCDWLYSSAVDYSGGKGLIEIIQLKPMIITI